MHPKIVIIHYTRLSLFFFMCHLASLFASCFSARAKFSNRKFYSCQIESYYFSPHSQMVFRVRKVGIEGFSRILIVSYSTCQFTNHLLKNSSEIMFSNLLEKKNSKEGLLLAQLRNWNQLFLRPNIINTLFLHPNLS